MMYKSESSTDLRTLADLIDDTEVAIDDTRLTHLPMYGGCGECYNTLKIDLFEKIMKCFLNGFKRLKSIFSM